MRNRILIQYGILLFAIGTVLTPAGWIEYHILEQTHGTLIFPTDNTYTDMAVAENFGFYQVWGLSKYSFEPIGSSLLYIVLLAVVFFVVGAYAIIPLIINVAAVVWFLAIFQRWLICQSVRGGYQLLAMLMLNFSISLPLLVISGMEYTLQLLFGFLFVISFLRLRNGQSLNKVYVYAILMTATNVEMIILLIAACGFIGFKTGWKLSFKIGGIGILPTIVFAAITFLKGSPFIPHQGVSRYRGQSQINFANVKLACIDSYNEYYTTARFVRRYIKEWGVASNSIGVLSYYSEGEKIDLGTNTSAGTLDSLIKRVYVRVVILFDKTLDTKQWRKWSKVACWGICRMDGVAEDSVSFYSFSKDSSFQADLRINLKEFESRLPPEVKVRYY